MELFSAASLVSNRSLVKSHTFTNLAAIVSTSLIVTLAFNLQNTTKSFDWILWVTLSFSQTFVFTSGNGLRGIWILSVFGQHHHDDLQQPSLGTHDVVSLGGEPSKETFSSLITQVICLLVCGAFFMDLFICVRVLLRNPVAKHSQVYNVIQ